MRHNYHLEGHGFALRPVERSDAAFIVELRSDPVKSRYLHPISHRVEDQEAYLDRYFMRPGDYYFVVERLVPRQLEGLAGLYDVAEATRRAEWGRWVFRDGSLASVESAWLIYRLAFEFLHLREVYCHTIAENLHVLSFHDSCGLVRQATLPAFVTLRGQTYDVVEHALTAELWPQVDKKLSRLTRMVAQSLLARAGVPPNYPPSVAAP